MLDLQSGLLMGFLGCTITFVGFFIAYLIAGRNHMKKYKKKVKGPMDDLMKDMPGWKADDCQ
tara:strand:- start:242 stop:427 length:186 start_codon:yes stop_codon:yes gene_type:complete